MLLYVKVTLNLHEPDVPDEISKQEINQRSIDFTSACFADNDILYVGQLLYNMVFILVILLSLTFLRSIRVLFVFYGGAKFQLRHSYVLCPVLFNSCTG